MDIDKSYISSNNSIEVHFKNNNEHVSYLFTYCKR